jgi:hypothetical protein
MNHLAGGRLFPGEHHRARELPGASRFSSLQEGSAFFEPGSQGYSVTREAGRLDGIELRTHGWSMEALQLEDVYSSYFSDEARFPKGRAVFDCALLMRNLGHEWHGAEDLYV